MPYQLGQMTSFYPSSQQYPIAWNNPISINGSIYYGDSRIGYSSGGGIMSCNTLPDYNVLGYNTTTNFDTNTTVSPIINGLIYDIEKLNETKEEEG